MYLDIKNIPMTHCFKPVVIIIHKKLRIWGVKKNENNLVLDFCWSSDLLNFSGP